KDGAVRFTDIPLVTRVPELMQAVRGTQVLLEIATTDEISLEVSCRVLEVFAGEGAMPDEDLDTDEELDEASAEAAADAAAEEAAEDAAEGAAEGADAAPEDADSEASEGDQDDEPSAPRDTGANPAA
ncbi:MAG TPA: ribonuclease II, partial [Cupriavidus sp.]|nr:ribonuclease II [Cupriavidus sp.]